MFEPWMLAAMEEAGYMDTGEGLVNRVAHYLADGSSLIISEEEFREACYVCNVDPDSFSQDELDKFEEKINKFRR